MGRWEQVKEEGVTLPLAAYGFIYGGGSGLLRPREVPTSQRPNVPKLDTFWVFGIVYREAYFLC